MSAASILSGQTLLIYREQESFPEAINIGVRDDHVGKGVGTALIREVIDAADNWLAFKRLELMVYTDNAPAIRLYEKFGFEREAIHRSYAFKAGAYVDALGQARLRY